MPRVPLVSVLAFLLLIPVGQAAAGAYRLVDADGTVHFTNAPSDPRYRRMAGISGTASGWLRLPGVQTSRYATEIEEAANRYGVPRRLVEALIRVESGFNAAAISTKGARGLMQLMPQTAAILGVRDVFNPRQNIDGGVRHLRGLIDRYPKNLRLVLAAYNAGEQAVNWYGGVPPYPETQQYVEKVIGEYSEDAGPGLPRSIYRYERRDGAVVYTNIPPVSRARR